MSDPKMPHTTFIEWRDCRQKRLVRSSETLLTGFLSGVKSSNVEYGDEFTELLVSLDISELTSGSHRICIGIFRPPHVQTWRYCRSAAVQLRTV